MSELNDDISNAVKDYIASLAVTEDEADGAPLNAAAVGKFAADLTSAQADFYGVLSQGLQNASLKNDDPSKALAVEAVRKLGFASLGTFYWMIEHRQTQLMKLYDFRDLSASPGGTSSNGNDENHSDEVAAQLRSISKVIDKSIGDTGTRLVANIVDSSSESVSDWYTVGGVVSAAVTSVFLEGGWFANIGDLNVSPIERVRHMGVVVTNSYYAALFTVNMIEAVSKSGSKAAESGGALTGWMAAAFTFVSVIAESIKEMFMEVASPILTGAFICANIIPAMPYIMLLAATFGYLIYIFEALIGANFWMLNHANPEGHEVFGKGGDGYTILLTLFLRPTLIVIGFVAGIGFNWVFGHIINVTIVAATDIQNTTPDGWVGNLSQFAGVIVVFSGLHVFAAYKSFSLTHELPNAILRWMGVSDHQDLGEREGKDLAMAIGTGAGGGMGSRTTAGRKAKPGGGDDQDNQGNKNKNNSNRNNMESGSKDKNGDA